MRKMAFVSAIVIVSSGLVPTTFGEIRVGIVEQYVDGLGADSTWAAAKMATTPLIQVGVKSDLSCPGIVEGKERPYRIDTPENRTKLSETARKHGCEIVAFCTIVHFDKGKDDADHIAWIEKVTKAAAEMKVPVIMMPLIAGDLDQDGFVKRAISFVKAVAPFAKADKVQLTVENLGPYLNKEEVLKPIMEAVPNDQVGLALDICNMYWFGHPLPKIYELARTFAPHVRYVHVKNIKYPADQRDKQRDKGWEYMKYAEPVRTGDLDFDRILGYYLEAGFKGNVVIEDDSLGKFDAAGKRKAIQEDAALLRELIEKKAKTMNEKADHGSPKVEFETTMGNFTIEVYPDKTPITAANFLQYVDEGFYDNTIFHRVISTFMIQGGGFSTSGGTTEQKTAGLHKPIQNEAKIGLKNTIGTIAMARTGAPHSATSQFFINVADNANLDHPSFDGWGYCAFGKVISGMDTIQKIKSVPTKANPMMGEKSQPVDPPIIIKARRQN